jgi:Mn2+/Fe2+ NRAMP family transporter
VCEMLVTLIANLQQVVYERPPPGELRRGLIALPPTPTTLVVVFFLTALVGATLRAHLRQTKPKKPSR